MTRTIIHVDMNAFFASVEQQSNPKLRNRPVAVIGAHKRSVITTASYEARSFGVMTGMTPREGKKLCPDLILVVANMEKYTHTCALLTSIFRHYTPLVEVYSIDEAFLDLTGSLQLFSSPATIALSIKEAIKKNFGLTCSIGIAPNKLLAKLGSDLQKPDGLVVIRPEKVATLLENLPVSKLCGVGPHLSKALAEMGIKTCGSLGRASTAALRDRFGSIGELLRLLGQGIDDSSVIPLESEPPPLSVSHSMTFPSDVSDRALMKHYLLKLSEMVAIRLRRYSLQARTVVLTVRYSDFTTFTRRLTAGYFFDQDMTVYRTILLIFTGITLRQNVRLLGVGLTNLRPRTPSLHLFKDEEKASIITQAMDRINNRYGDFTISRGTLFMAPTV